MDVSHPVLAIMDASNARGAILPCTSAHGFYRRDRCIRRDCAAGSES
jgi:hypothetical protein